MGTSDFQRAIRSAFHNCVPLVEIPQTLGEGVAAIECLCDLRGIGARKLKENVRAHGENGARISAGY